MEQGKLPYLDYRASSIPAELQVDVMEQLGFNGNIPPYASTRGRDILRGVNYASAAAGIRDETGRQLLVITNINYCGIDI
uniref:Uncharacterized protein n=1 Tax=Solanum lycopersicum TaxID=4081 RepID=A0A3Q7F2J3_SOLLC